MASTLDNLKDAFAGESQASTKYLAFARKADKEGHQGIAMLFRAAATAEIIHARNHLEVMEGVGSTEGNLKEAIAGENTEHIQMYPEFIEAARKEQQPKAERTFDWACKVEMVHESLYKAALEALQGGKNQDKEYFVCQVCGFTAEGDAPNKCPICGTPKPQFLKVA